VKTTVRHKRALDGLRQDIRDHIERETQDNIDKGMIAEEARRQAMIRFGNVALTMEDTQAVWGWPWLHAIHQDLRYVLRTLRRKPAFALVVILTLGFGIGLNTATFSIVNAALIRPLGFVEPERLMALHERLGVEDVPFSPPDFLDVKRDQQSFEDVAAYGNLSFELSGHSEPMRIDGSKVSASLFPLLGVRPLLGRDFRPEEDRPGTDVAVLSWGLWQSRYGGDRSIVGQTVTLDRRPYTVIGVMPTDFEFPRRGPQSNNKPASLWVPMALTDGERQERGSQFNRGVIARLKRGVSIDEARAELDVLARRINANYPPVLQQAGFPAIGLSAAPLRDEIVGRMQRPLLLLLGAVGLVLLVTCANVATLVLSRAASRTREIAVRIALGASRARLVQLLLAEAAVLSIVGGMVGLVASRFIVGAVPKAVSEAIPAGREFSIDVRVLAFTAGIAIATTFLFALTPLGSVARARAGLALQETSRSTPGPRRHRMQAGLVVTTVMLACVLLVGAGLFIRSFSALMATDAGFNPDRVLTASLTLPRASYSTAASIRSFHRALFTRASALPGVRSAALVTDLPFERYENRVLSAEGVELAGGPPSNTNLSWVYGPYFQTLGIRLKSGRVFSDVEALEPRGVVIVNERLARAFWPGQDAVGKRLRWGLNVAENQNPWLTIIGVIADVADGPLGAAPSVHAYEPFSQFPDSVMNTDVPTAFGRQLKLMVRTDADPHALVSAVRAEIGRIDRQLAIESIATMVDRVGEMVAPRRFSAMVLGAFATGSLLLAAVGLYGLLVFTVSERAREIAVRLALGAQRAEILRMVIGHGLKLVAFGLVLGLGISYGVGRAIASLLYETEGHDIVTFSAVPIVLLLIAVIACALPAYRASRLEPMVVLRTE
jgi:putative ABC transport system permease protein